MKFNSNLKQATSVTDWQQYRLKSVPIRSLSRSKVASYEDLQRHINFLRSDHLQFWYHNHSSFANSLSAVLLTDTGNKKQDNLPLRIMD